MAAGDTAGSRLRSKATEKTASRSRSSATEGAPAIHDRHDDLTAGHKKSPVTQIVRAVLFLTYFGVSGVL